MLEAAGRSPMRAAHLQFMVTAAEKRTLVAHVFVRGDRQIEIGDSVFGVKESLIRDFQEQAAGTPTPDGRGLGAPLLPPGAWREASQAHAYICAVLGACQEGSVTAAQELGVRDSGDSPASDFGIQAYRLWPSLHSYRSQRVSSSQGTGQGCTEP
jgi:hypothetical protein